MLIKDVRKMRGERVKNVDEECFKKKQECLFICLFKRQSEKIYII